MKPILLTHLITITLLAQMTHAQNAGRDSESVRSTTESSAGSDGSESRLPPRKDRKRDRSLPQISVIDKLLAVEAALNSTLARTNEDEWIRDYQRLYSKFQEDGHLTAIRDQGKNQAYVALALGVKASDAVMALKARDLEALNNCAEQIDLLARNMGATDGELGMAGTVRHYANKKQWFSAFLALGRMQRDVTNYLESSTEKKKRDLAILVGVGAWLQGGRVVTHVIDANYTDWSSNVLREPRLVALIQENLASIDPGYLNDELVSKIMKALPDIHRLVDVGLSDPVKRADVKELHVTFTSFVEAVMEVKVETKPQPEVPVKTPTLPAKASSSVSSPQPATVPASPATKPPKAVEPTSPPKPVERPSVSVEPVSPPKQALSASVPPDIKSAELPSTLKPKILPASSSSSMSLSAIAAIAAAVGGFLWYRKTRS